MASLCRERAEATGARSSVCGGGATSRSARLQSANTGAGAALGRTPGAERGWRSGRKGLTWIAELLLVLKSAHRLHGCTAAQLPVLLKSTMLAFIARE
jgi:hypothetical protein